MKLKIHKNCSKCKELKSFQKLYNTLIPKEPSEQVAKDVEEYRKKKYSREMKCDFCKKEGDWTNTVRTTYIEKKDGSDVIVCDDCLNLFANQEWDKLTEKLRKRNET